MHSTATSSVRVKTQPSLIPSPKPALNQQMIGSNHMNIRPPSNAFLKPQQHNVLQATQPTNAQITSNMNNSIGHLQVNHPTGLGPNVLQPQRSNALMSAQPAVKPQTAKTANIETSAASNFTNLSISHALQMQGASPGVSPIQSASNTVEPRSHTSTSGVLLSQQPPVLLTPASMPYGGMNTGNSTGKAAGIGLFQQPLIATPVVHTFQGNQYEMASGANPFSDINDLL